MRACERKKSAPRMLWQTSATTKGHWNVRPWSWRRRDLIPYEWIADPLAATRGGPQWSAFTSSSRAGTRETSAPLSTRNLTLDTASSTKRAVDVVTINLGAQADCAVSSRLRHKQTTRTFRNRVLNQRRQMTGCRNRYQHTHAKNGSWNIELQQQKAR